MKYIIPKFFFTLLLFLCLIFSTATAQQYNFKNYGPKNGLAGSNVTSIFQDSKGFLWVGTDLGGLSRFDYKTFVNFTIKEGLVGNSITYITEDKKGNIWIATTDGVSMFDGIRFKNYTQKEGLAKGTVYWIYADANDQLFFAVDNGGLNVFDGNKFNSITTKNGLTSNNVYNIVQDKKRDYWLGLSNGIAKYDGKKIIAYDKIKEVNNKAFFSSLVDSKGNVWFGGVNGNGIVKYDGEKFEKFNLPKDVEGDFFGSIIEDKKHNLWFATDHGALKYDGKNFHLFDENQGLSSNSVSSLCCDYEGNVWIGTAGGGVDLINNESFVNYTDKQGLSSNKINIIYEEKSDAMIIGTQGGGLNIFENSNIFSLSINALSQKNLSAISQNNIGEFWIGTENEGIFVFKKSGNNFTVSEHITKFDDQKIQAVIKISVDKKGGTWIATYGSGVFYIKPNKQVENYNSKIGTVSSNISALFEDSKGDIWLGTGDAGIIKIDLSAENKNEGHNIESEKFTFYNERDGLANKSVWSIIEDDNHNLYFGTADGGLSWFDGKQFKTISTSDGLCSNNITALAWDSIDKCIWIGTNKGINKLKLKEDFKVQSIRYYGEQDGFKGMEVNQNALLIDKQGLLWFGTNNGLYRYNRNLDIPNSTSPRIHLSGIRLAYQTVDWKKYADSVDLQNNLPYNLKLSHNNNHLTFDFQAFTTDNVKYSYLLEGQDIDWSPLSNNTEANFSNIAPGKTYTFRVKALNSIGIQSQDEIAFTFTINPPWWQTWWFYTLTVLFISGSVFGFIHYRTSKLAKEKKVLEEKVTERTHELKEAIKEITDSINYAQRIQKAILPPLSDIADILTQSFILFKPKDIVSGDFYWFSETENKLIIAAADCTGHGVPGAFMSTIGSEKLNEAVALSEDVSDILQLTNIRIKKVLRQTAKESTTHDGMDIAICAFNKEISQLEYAGANRPIWIIRNRKNEIEEIKATKVSLGGFTENTQEFEKHTIPLLKGDTIYISSDGFADQFGLNNKKLKTKKFKEELLSIQSQPMQDQKQYLDSFIENWRGNLEQTDDILVIGIRI